MYGQKIDRCFQGFKTIENEVINDKHLDAVENFGTKKYEVMACIHIIHICKIAITRLCFFLCDLPTPRLTQRSKWHDIANASSSQK
jgi:hypothetical protein